MEFSECFVAQLLSQSTPHCETHKQTLDFVEEFVFFFASLDEAVAVFDEEILGRLH